MLLLQHSLFRSIGSVYHLPREDLASTLCIKGTAEHLYWADSMSPKRDTTNPLSIKINKYITPKLKVTPYDTQKTLTRFGTTIRRKFSPVLKDGVSKATIFKPV